MEIYANIPESQTKQASSKQKPRVAVSWETATWWEWQMSSEKNGSLGCVRDEKLPQLVPWGLFQKPL